MKLKQLSIIFILNHINNLIDPAKIYMTLLATINIQSNYFNFQVHLLDFCLLHYLLSSDSKAMTLLVVSSLLTSLSKTFTKKKLN